MSKQKTKKQKMKALEKRQHSSQPNMQSMAYTVPEQAVNTPHITYAFNPGIPQQNYTGTHTLNYLSRDLTRTIILSIGIITTQLILYLLFKSHLVNIPSIGY